MGILDSVTSGIGSVAHALDVGQVVKGTVDSVLPKNMAFVGDLAGAAVDYETGNYIGAAKLGYQALKDLPQATNGQQAPQGATAGGTSQGASAPKPALEPSPPPLASRDGKPFDWNDLLSAIKALTAALNGQSTSTAAKPADTAPAQATSGSAATATAHPDTPAPTATTNAPPRTASAPPLAPSAPSPTTSVTTRTTTTRSTQQSTGGWANRERDAGWRNDGRGGSTTTVTTTTVTTGSNAATTSAWKGQPTTAAPATSRQAATSAAPPAPNPVFAAVQSDFQRAIAALNTSDASSSASAPAASKPAGGTSSTSAPTNTSSSGTGGATKSSATSSSADNKGQTISSLSQMQGMSNAAFMDAVSNGHISPDLAKDPAAMMAIQQRMNDITQMNNLMTAMMRAMHDMQMAVIQNIRI